MSLIVIEGIDGSGKETQTRLLVNWLKQQQRRNVSTFDFPSYQRSPFGRIIGRFLKGEFGDPVSMDPFQTALLYAGDRMHSKAEMTAALQRGDVVVLNRYVPSNLAYGCAKLTMLDRQRERDDLIAFTRQVEYQAAGLPIPDLVVVLDMGGAAVASALIDAKPPRQYLEGERGARDKYETDLIFQGCVRQEYLRLAGITNGWHVINCSGEGGKSPRSIEAIRDELRARVQCLV